jgi:hypothetical protein
MSKTIRRRGSKLPWWYGLSGSQPWEWYNDKTCKDKWIGPKTATKAYTRERRRSDERQMVENIKKDVEIDTYDLEKEYLGHIWHFD